MTWWNNATTQQKLTQIDGGIALGMTAEQISLASETTVRAVRQFALYHGRKIRLAHRHRRPPSRAVFDIALDARSSGWAMP